MNAFAQIVFVLLSFLFSGLASAESTLYQGWGLQPGQGITSQNGEYTLLMQGDGDLVFYRLSYSGIRWHTNTSGAWGAFLTMQPDGNAVTYFDPPCPPAPKGEVQYCKPSTGRYPIWYSSTGGNRGAYMTAQNDGNLVVFTASGQPLWSIGPDPVKSIKDPSKIGDLVGRDMEHERPYSFLGHIGFYDGHGIFEVLNDGASNAAAYNSLGAFKSRSPGAKYWGAASTNIPQYFIRGCYKDYCGKNAYETVDAKTGMAYRAFQVLVLGADYTYFVTYARATPKYASGDRAIRGIYRCDTFVLDVMTENGIIIDTDGGPLNVAALPSQSPVRRWVEFMAGVRSGVITPLNIFNQMKNFVG